MDFYIISWAAILVEIQSGKLESFILDKWASFPDHLILVVEKLIHNVSYKTIQIISSRLAKVLAFGTLCILSQRPLFFPSRKV